MKHFRSYLIILAIGLGIVFAREATATQCPQWPDQSKKVLTAADLEGCDCRQLELLRNEIFARHGRKFKRKDLQDHFASQSWYKYDPSNPEGKKGMNSIEQANAAGIADYEKYQGCRPGAASTVAPTNNSSSGCPAWPAQSIGLLTDADLKDCDCKQLEILRNEIYARHGRKFKRKDLRDHFESQSWYRHDPNNPEGSKGLNSYEQKNAAFISRFEKNVQCRHLRNSWLQTETLGGFSVTQDVPYGQVTSKFGNPESVEGQVTDLALVSYPSKGIKFNICTNSIVGLTAFGNSTFKTSKGIGIGDSKAKVIAAYGKLYTERNDDGGRTLGYSTGEEMCAIELVFTFSGDKVTQILLILDCC